MSTLQFFFIIFMLSSLEAKAIEGYEDFPWWLKFIVDVLFFGLNVGLYFFLLRIFYP